ncbi:MAG: nitroreductase family protein [Psychrilyobacter sp.]|nr:nitroreductase family protein [Psychrilyobacter sp.]
MNLVIETIKSRRSIRKYETKKIEQEKIEAIVEAGLYAPSGHNKQPWHFTVLENKEIMDKISVETKKMLLDSETPIFRKMGRNEKLHILYNAPTVIIVSGKKEDSYSMDADLAAATQNMLLAAESLGLASCWVGLIVAYFNNKTEIKVRNEEVGIPEGYEVQYAVTLGYSPLYGEAKPHKRAENTVNYVK